MTDAVFNITQGDVLRVRLDDEYIVNQTKVTQFPTDGRIGKVRTCVVLSSQEDIERGRNLFILPLTSHKNYYPDENLRILTPNGEVSYANFNAMQMLSRSRIISQLYHLKNEKFDEINRIVMRKHGVSDCSMDARIRILINQIHNLRGKLAALSNQDIPDAEEAEKVEFKLSKKEVDGWPIYKAIEFLQFVDDKDLSAKEVMELYSIANYSAYYRFIEICRDAVKNVG